MSDDKTETTTKGTESNEVVGQTPDQFFDPVVEQAKRDVDPPKDHASKGMTTLGDSEAYRLSDGQGASPQKG